MTWFGLGSNGDGGNTDANDWLLFDSFAGGGISSSGGAHQLPLSGALLFGFLSDGCVTNGMSSLLFALSVVENIPNLAIIVTLQEAASTFAHLADDGGDNFGLGRPGGGGDVSRDGLSNNVAEFAVSDMIEAIVDEKKEKISCCFDL